MGLDTQVAGRAIGLVELEPGGRLSDLAYTRILEALFDRRLPAGLSSRRTTWCS